MAIAKKLFLINRLRDMMNDPEVQKVSPLSKEVLVPPEYQNLRHQLREYILHGKGHVDKSSSFVPFENAGFFPFTNGGELLITTPKGVFRVL